jgi:anti-sigma factor RsiW
VLRVTVRVVVADHWPIRPASRGRGHQPRRTLRKMRAEHERFEAMAVGHVLGGLEPAAASHFREHLVGCRSCRARVAELRDLAADLAAVERDERTRATVSAEQPEQVEPDATFEPAGRGLATRNLALLAALVAVALGLFGFWNLHLRAVAANAQAIAQRQEEALAVLATGVAPATEVADGLHAVAATDGDHLGFSLAGIPELAADEVLVGWLTDGALPAPRAALLVRPEQVTDGLVAAGVELEGAGRFVLSKEIGPPGEAPGGTPLLTVRLGTD